MVKFDFYQFKSFLKAKPKIMENKKIKYKFGEKSKKDDPFKKSYWSIHMDIWV